MRALFRSILAILCGVNTAVFADAARKPNVVIFYIDDMGWAQPTCYPCSNGKFGQGPAGKAEPGSGGKPSPSSIKAPTPNIDALAASGVLFTNGYVSAPVCSPSRVALMTGQYQARTGHDNLTVPHRPETNLLSSETTMAQRMKSAGYVTGIFGKWHLGAQPGYLPASRGFDESIGSTANLGEKDMSFYRGEQISPALEGSQIADGAPLTTPVFAREAMRFIEKHKDQLWFVYLPFNAVHAKPAASEEWLKKFPDLPRNARAYEAMAAECDDAVGQVMNKLRELKLDKDTLVFLISDNGGANPIADTGGLRGKKWTVWEGGIRVPWIAAWPGTIPGPRVSDQPVIQLDVLPTALAAAGVTVDPAWHLDGVNILPFLEEKMPQLPERALYFRYGPQFAVRLGNWKLVKAAKDMPPMLVDLSKDPAETTDLAALSPEKVRELQGLFDQWNAGMKPPRWEDKRNAGEWTKKAGGASQGPQG